MVGEPLFGGRVRSALALWHRLPVAFRAFLSALAVVIAGIQVWRYLIAANLAISAQIPWAAAAMAVYLWFFWKYLNGRGWPRSTGEARQRDLRAHPLTQTTWRWALAAGGSFIAAIAPLTVILDRLFPIPHLLPAFLQQLPPLTLVSFLLMSSIVAGVVEEAAFRGYLQSPLERRHGPVMAILITSTIFVLFHLPGRPTVSPSYLFLVALASLNYGTLAYLTNSILPGLVLHASGDAASFALTWWFHVALGPREQQGMSLGAAVRDPIFLTNCGEFVVLAAVSAWAFGKLAKQVHGSTLALDPSKEVQHE